MFCACVLAVLLSQHRISDMFKSNQVWEWNIVAPKPNMFAKNPTAIWTLITGKVAPIVFQKATTFQEVNGAKTAAATAALGLLEDASPTPGSLPAGRESWENLVEDQQEPAELLELKGAFVYGSDRVTGGGATKPKKSKKTSMQEPHDTCMHVV